MSLDISVIVPVHNEEGAAAQLARDIAEAFAGRAIEMIFVDDKSTDQTLAQLLALKAELPSLRVISHETNAGQSRAIRTGLLAAIGKIVVTLDGDGQNPPQDAPTLVAALEAAGPNVGLVAGQRVKRQDSAAKRWASRWANSIRKSFLNDGADDTGCGLKAIRRDVFLRLPYFDHFHRYIPALVRREQFDVIFLPVGHRSRESGASKYTNWGRLKVALKDLQGVKWLQSRARNPGNTQEL